MKRILPVVILMFMVLGCELFLSVRSDHVRIDIGDNVSDNKTDKNKDILYVYAIGEKKPFAAVDSGSGLFYYSTADDRAKTELIPAESGRTAFIDGNFGRMELVLADICENRFPAEKDAAKIRKGWESFAAACDLSGCAPDGFDIFAYAERNGFDAYCSAE